MPDDNGFSDDIKGRLESGPSDDAMKNIGGDVAPIFLLQSEGLQGLRLRLLRLHLDYHDLSLDFILLHLLFFLMGLAILGGRSRTLDFFLIKGRIMRKGEGWRNGIKKLLRLKGRLKRFVCIWEGLGRVAVAVLSSVVIGDVEAVEVKHIIIISHTHPTLNPPIHKFSSFTLSPVPASLVFFS